MNESLYTSVKNGFTVLKLFLCHIISTYFIRVSLLIFFFVFQSKAQTTVPSCSEIKNGIFYYYPKNSADRFLEFREGEYLHETNIITGDTMVWQVKWVSDCIYSLKYVSSSSKIDEQTLGVLKKHKLVYEILTITNTYYLFRGFVDKTSNPPIVADTMWLIEKATVTNNELFSKITNIASLKKAHFSDTSKYAVLYVYRPKKLGNSMSNYMIYFDDNFLCVGQNNTGYVYKVLKEGSFQVKSRLNKSESAVRLDVKFGKSYYIKSMVNWGLYGGLSNYKLEMAIMRPEEGKIEFEEVNSQY